jgi:hypothetical protein
MIDTVDTNRDGKIDWPENEAYLKAPYSFRKEWEYIHTKDQPGSTATTYYP